MLVSTEGVSCDGTLTYLKSANLFNLKNGFLL